MPSSILAILGGVGFASAVYTASLLSVLRVPFIENHAVYMHRLHLIGRKNIRHPEQFGFAHRQVTPFWIKTRDGVKLHAWHVLPIGLYYRNVTRLADQRDPRPPEADFRDTLNFKLLREDPDARLVIHTHGSSGALAAYCRADSYRSLSSLAPNKIHVLAFDYRGFGLSTGTPTEEGLGIDTQAVFDWANRIAGLPAERIVVFGQSMGSGVAIALVRDLALQKIHVAGLIITGAFTDVQTMLSEYRSFFGFRPFGPLARFPGLMAMCSQGMQNKWLNRNGLVDVVSYSSSYHIQIFHAQDDPIVPWHLSNDFFNHAAMAGSRQGMANDEFQEEKAKRRKDMGEGGWCVEWHTSKGLIRQEVPKYGNHDKIMAQPQIAMAVMRAFQHQDPGFRE
ncbi:Alpha/Beta hydrolase protein [Phaeosphaeria sp. MPI-PUGE-AT-0046c]|nr:Alpha/Beta hydrolase protein [Phaeosphaeria sp. MPI-PUGE-AT-0046c]